MARIECHHGRIDGVTLVTCRLASDAAVRVTVEPTHDGPVWPPRRQGVPAEGWTDGTWTGVVEADRPRGVGYATPTDVGDGDPVTIAAVEPADGEECDAGDCDTTHGQDAISARDVIRSLGDPSPARDVVGPGDAVVGDGGETVESETGDTGTVAATSDSNRGDRGTDAGGADTHPEADAVAGRHQQRAGTAADSTAGGASGVGATEATASAEPDTGARTAPDSRSVGGAARLDAIEERLDTAAALSAVSTPAEAREAVTDAGGIEAVRALVEHLEADRAYLRRVRERTGDLAGRAEETTVPLAALERLA